ncbi:ABC transporter substrate-binding protein [Microlunatus speluncae]|uniref:ABC transporter substrate-binding protein n=1 Tax=Microlunatus speluncae TaxID=2594267 RepID=UPI0012660E70|nr:ABC transporter substrate-binding protein [Microlunatus speluncae]
MRSHFRGWVARATVVGAAVLALTACGTGGPAGTGPSEGGDKKGGIFTTIDANRKITPGAPNNPYNPKGNAFTGYNVFQLAWNKANPKNINDFFPGLAASWEASEDLSKVTIKLQPNAKWSDGTPVTGKDVQTSFAIGYVAGTLTGINLGEIKVVDDSTVEFNQLPGEPSQTFMLNLITAAIVPDAQYGPQLPADIWDLIKKTDAGDKAATTKIAELTKKITAFNPPDDLSAGPFVLAGINPGEAILKKNEHFFAADKITPDQVKLRNYAGNNEIWNYLQSGQLDYGPFTAMPTNILQSIERAGNKQIVSTSYVQASLSFDQSVQPFDKVQTRQAFAHLLDRDAITKVGQPVGGSPSETTTGMVKAAGDVLITPETHDQLNPYGHDPAKAEQLLIEAGLTKGGDGKWLLADGKPFTVTMQAVTGFSDWIAASNVVCSELNDFGIACQNKVSPDFAVYQEEMAAGKYPFGWWLTGVGTIPNTSLGRIWGTPYGYNLVGSKVVYKARTEKESGNWLSGPQEITLPDGSKVKPGELVAGLRTLKSEQQAAPIQQIVLATNTAVPMIAIWDYQNVQFINEKRFTNFPDGKDPGLQKLSPGVWMSLGYIQAK